MDVPAERPQRRIFGAALILVAAVLVGLGLGVAFSPPGSTRALAVPALALQTLLTVGALPRRERSVELRPGLILLGLHLGLASLPLALVALAIGLDDPLGFGLFLIAAAPPAALIPAYADVAEVPGGDLLVFVLLAYALALGLTPALVYLAAGELVGLGPIASRSARAWWRPPCSPGCCTPRSPASRSGSAAAWSTPAWSSSASASGAGSSTASIPPS